MFKTWRKRRQLEAKELDLAIKELEIAEKSLNDIAEARNTVVDNELKDWSLIGSSTGGIHTQQEHEDMLISAYKLYHNNPYARTIVRSLVKFVFGKGPVIVPNEKKEKQKKQCLDSWKEFHKNNKLNKKDKEFGVRAFRDGEFFLREFVEKSDGTSKIRFIRANKIKQPQEKIADDAWSYGIKTDLDDVEEVLKYAVVSKSGIGTEKVEYIDAKEILHEKIFCDSDQKRGVSILRIAAKRIKQYDEWLEDRIHLNKVRSAIALIRNVDSSSQKIKDIRDEGLSDNVSSTRKMMKVPKRGTIITASKGIKYEMLSPRIQASDVVEDGRAMLLSIAAAVGFPDMIFTSDYSNANYGSTLVAQNPWVREIEDWQDFFTSFYQELYRRVIQNKKDANKLPDNVDDTCIVEFPPMIAADLEKMAKAYEVLFKYRALSKKTWQGRMGLDPEIEKINMELEQGDEVYPMSMTPGGAPQAGGLPLPAGAGKPGAGKSPFNLPMSPVNQFGQEIMDCIHDNDWDRLIEIAEEIGDFDWKSLEEKEIVEKQEVYDLKNFAIDIKEVFSNLPKQDIIVNVQEKDVKIDNPVTVNIPENPVTVNIAPTEVNIEQPNITVEATQVKVEPIINVEQPDIKMPDINIPETKVIVEQPNITIEPAEVKVNVNIPERKLVSKKVTRDKDGNVTGIEEI